jgi:hypothetical protein
MELHNLFFSIWYHHMLYSAKIKYLHSDSKEFLIYLRSFIDTLIYLIYFFTLKFSKILHLYIVTDVHHNRCLMICYEVVIK